MLGIPLYIIIILSALFFSGLAIGFAIGALVELFILRHIIEYVMMKYGKG